MEKSRYFTALGVAVVVFAVGLIFLPKWDFFYDATFEAVLISYALGAAVGDLILGSGLALQVGIVVGSLGVRVFLFWLSIFLSSCLGMIIGLATFTFAFAALCGALLIAIALFLLLSSVLFPFHMISLSNDLY